MGNLSKMAIQSEKQETSKWERKKERDSKFLELTAKEKWRKERKVLY